MKRAGKILIGSALMVMTGTLGAFASAQATERSSDEWVFGAQAYLWAAGIETEFPDGSTNQVKFSDVVENLEMGGMVMLGATKGRWGVLTDFIYLSVEDKPNAPLAPGLELRSTGIDSWIINAAGQYEIARTDNLSVNVLAGVRYLWLEVPTKLRQSSPLEPGTRNFSPSTDYWDGVVGTRLMWNLNDKWYSTLHADVSTGDTDLTFQGAISAGYRFDNVDALFGYRYMNIDFDDGEPLDELTLDGPVVGVRFFF
jgi:hypothetical protein